MLSKINQIRENKLKLVNTIKKEADRYREQTSGYKWEEGRNSLEVED